jgi:hypothetical protein
MGELEFAMPVLPKFAAEQSCRKPLDRLAEAATATPRVILGYIFYNTMTWVRASKLAE